MGGTGGSPSNFLIFTFYRNTLGWSLLSIYVCLCLCLCLCLYKLMQLFYLSIYMHTYTHAYIHPYVHLPCIHTHYILIYICHAYIHTCIYTSLCTFAYTCIYIDRYVYVCVRARVYTSYTYIQELKDYIRKYV